MDIPTPEPGQVVRYAYLWSSEHDAGREEGIKDRPVAIVMALLSAGGDMRVAVVPITHTPPANPEDAIEIPAIVKTRLGLDDLRSWVVVTELNVFAWPGPDLRPVGDGILYGYLPAGFFRSVRDRLASNIRAGRIRQVPRTG